MTVLSDAEIARKLERELNSNPVPEYSNIRNYIPANNVRSADLNATQNIVSNEWELLDPTPDVHALFRAFDVRFFKTKLQCVQLEWSKRMYNCAGICYLRTNRMGKACTIRLSEPLLKLRSRKDLVETLLHEMIHAYCFVLGIREGNGGHGPTFVSIMRQINLRAGTNITVYHSFHDEVELYKTHIWRCNGICQHRGPFFGYVKRTMNRAPGPSDYWWISHQQSCGGYFEKKSQSEKSPPRRKKEITTPKSKDIRTFFVPSPKKATSAPVESSENVKKNVRDVWSTKFPNTNGGASTSQAPKEVWSQIDDDDDVLIEDPQIPIICLNDTVEPSTKISPEERQSQIMEEILSSINGENDSNDVIELIDDEYNDDDNTIHDILQDQSVLEDLFGKDTLMEDYNKKTDGDNITCPVCELYLPRDMLSDHMEGCLGIMEHVEFNPKKVQAAQKNPATKRHKNSPSAAPKRLKKNSTSEASTSAAIPTITNSSSTSTTSTSSSTRVPCPVCNEKFPESEINDHLDLCLVLKNMGDYN